MSDDAKKIIVDDDWKAQARREKETLAEKEKPAAKDALPDVSFAELVNLLAMQTMVGLGLVAGAGGQPIPPNLEAAKHFIDMLAMLESKTKGNVSTEEKKILDDVLYELRMRYVQRTSAASPGAAGMGL